MPRNSDDHKFDPWGHLLQEPWPWVEEQHLKDMTPGADDSLWVSLPDGRSARVLIVEDDAA